MRTYRPWWHKLALAFMLVTAIGFIVTGTIHIIMGNEYVRSERISRMETSASEIDEAAGEYIVSASTAYMDNIVVQVWHDHLQYVVTHESDHVQGLTLLINQDGYVWMEYPSLPNTVRARYMSEGDSRVKLPDEAVEALEAMDFGETYITGDLYGLFSNPEMKGDGKWMTVARKTAVFVRGERLTTYTLVSIPESEVYYNTVPVIRVYMIPFITALVICFLMAILISRSMSRQITGLSKAARKVAVGEFDVDMPKASRDEMGLLVINFERMTASLAELERMRGQFVSDVSHELRTPMTSILGFITAIQDGTIPAEQRDYYLSIVREETERLQKLTNDLLELTRLESGQTPIEKAPTDINDLCQRVVVSMSPMFEAKGINAVLELENRPLYGLCDGEMIRRVLVNLIHNAIKFTPEGGRVTVGAGGDGSRVTVYVRDTGPGLSDEDLEHIWDRFYKGDKSRGVNSKGAGLGLSIAWNIIREHGETISACNRPEGGAEFSFNLHEEMKP